MNYLLKNRKSLLTVVLMITAVFAWFIQDIRTGFSFEDFFPPENDEYRFYKQYRETFHHDDNVIHIALKAEQGNIFNPDFLRDADRIFDGINELEDVDTVISPLRMEWAERTPLDVKTGKYFPLDEPEKLKAGIERFRQDSLISMNFIGRSGRWLSAYVIINREIMDLPRRDTLVKRLDQYLELFPQEKIVSGIPYVRSRYVERTNEELLIFISLSFVMTLIILTLIYRSWWGIVIPLTGVALTMVWFIGFMGLAGQKIDLMIGLLPPIIFVVAISDIIHLITKYAETLKTAPDKHAAMRITLRQIGLATLLTSITTAIGFASLVVSAIPPVRTFGIFAAVAVIFAFIIAIILVPGTLMNIDANSILKSKGTGNSRFWHKLLEKVSQLVNRHPKSIISGFTLLIIVSIIGFTQISFNAYLLDDVSPRDPLRKNMIFFEEEYFGFRPFEIAIMPAEGKTVTDPEILQDIDKIESWLHTRERFSPFLSPAALIKNLNRFYHFHKERYFRIPKSEARIEELLDYVKISGGSRILSQVMTDDRQMGRISGQMRDIGTENFAQLRMDLADFISDSTNTENFDYRMTGSAVLTELNTVYLRKSLLGGLAIAFLLIGVIIGGLFRSWRMFLLGMIPNLVPLLFTAGLMGFLGITMKASTSIVFVVAFGIAVDDTIHLLSRYRLELQNHPPGEALHRAILGTGKALILTTLILLAGFSLLLFSNFGGTFIIGLFSAATLLMALITDLLLLPVLIRWMGRA